MDVRRVGTIISEQKLFDIEWNVLYTYSILW